MKVQYAVKDIEQRIRTIRSCKVMLDSDLAELYGVPVKVLLQAVKRNKARFPNDFMFQLAENEWGSLRSQIVTLKTGRGEHRKFRPYVFTEQGVAMLSSVLRSQRAVRVNIAIMRAFVQLRQIIALNRGLALRLDELERKTLSHDRDIQGIIEAIRQLMAAPEEKTLKIDGFREKAKFPYGRRALSVNNS